MWRALSAPGALAALLGLGVVGQAADEPGLDLDRLTLGSAVQQALERNDRLIGALENEAQADLSLRLARAGFRPKMTPNILGSFGQSNVKNQTYRLDLSQKFTTGTELRATVGTSSDQNQLGNYYSTDTTFSLSQPLLKGFGRSVSRRSLSSAEARSSEVRRERVLAEQQVAIDVAGAYYRIVSQREMVSVSEKTLERSRQLLEASKAKLEAGKVSQLDVFRAEQLVAQAEGQLLDSQGAVEDAMDQLRVLLRRGPDYLFEVVDTIPETVDTSDVEGAVETALATRLELTSATEALLEAERSVAYNRNQLLPQFDLNLALTRRGVADSLRSSFGFDKFDFATFFAISMPVDRTPLSVQYYSARIDRDRRRREIENLKMRIVEQVRRAVRQVTRLTRSLDVATASLEFAEKEVEVASLRYQRGLSNNLDVVNAEETLLGARSRRIGLLAEIAVARLSLKAAVGTLDPRRDMLAETPAP